MKICNSCGQSIKDNSLFCPFCGSKTDVTGTRDADMTDIDMKETEAEPAGVEETLPVNEETDGEEITLYAEERSSDIQDLAKGSPADNPYMQENVPQSVQGVQQSAQQNPYMQTQAAQAAQTPQQAQAAQQPYLYAQPMQQRVQSPYMQQPMQQPTPQPSYYAQGQANMQAYQAVNEKPLSVGEWMLTLIILSVPFANIIMMFVWAFSEGNKSRKNFCRAYLIFVAIVFVLTIAFIIFMIVVLGEAASDFHSSYYYYY